MPDTTPARAARRFPCAAPATLVLAAGLLLGCASTDGGGAPAPSSGAVPQITTPPPSSSASGLLPAAQAYVDAVNRADLDAVVTAFAPDGAVLDVSQRITGRDAIRRWADNEVIGGALRVDGVTVIAPDVQRLRVHWAPSGSAGWAADYTFTVRGDQVVLADLQYAT